METIPQQEQTNIIRVVLFGPESTGKTTLAKHLAEHYKTNWVAEFSREYCQEKWDKHHKKCEYSDVIPIAVGQMTNENKLVKSANKILISDTDIFETKIYSEIYYNQVPDELNQALETYHCDLYLLTYIDTPWIADDLRDKPNEREEMFAYFEQALIANNKHYIVLKGTPETRLNTAISIIDNLLETQF